LEIKAALQNVRREYIASLNQVEALQMSFRALLALDFSVRVVPEGTLSHSTEDVAYDESFLKAMSQRPEFRQYEAQVKAQRSAVEIARSESRPSIYAGWDYYSSSTSQFAGSALPRHGWQDYSVAGVVFSWPLFDGWSTKAKVEQAIADLKEAQLLQERNVYDVAVDLKNAYLSLKDSLAKIEASRADLVRYMENLTVTEKRYARGIKSHLDLEDANLQMEISSFNNTLALYDYWTARSLFDKAQGESYV
jgi:outer membrane protein TolC